MGLNFSPPPPSSRSSPPPARAIRVDDLCEDCAAKAMMEEEGYSEFDSSLDYDDSDMFGSEFGGEDWDG